MTAERQLTVSLEHLHPFTLNPRLKAKASESLVASLKAQGQLQSMLVRPHPKKKGDFEVICGNRRLDGLAQAGIETADVRVRALTDAEAIEAALAENAEREDVPPLEEADAYQALVDRGHTAERIAERIGKSVAHVRARLRLQGLTDEAREAFEAGRLTLAGALVLAQVEDEPTQKATLEELQEDYEGRVPTAAAVREIVRGQLHILADAPFDREDELLYPSAPRCSSCPKRTAAQAELFADADPADDSCLDAVCWRAKSVASAEVKLSALVAGGAVLLDDAATEKALGYARDRVTSHQWVDIDESLSWEMRDLLGVPQAGTTKKTVRTALGVKKLGQLKRFALVDRAGGVHEVVEHKELVALLKPPQEQGERSKKKAPPQDAGNIKEWAELERRVAAAIVSTTGELSWPALVEGCLSLRDLKRDKGPFGVAAQPLFAALSDRTTSPTMVRRAVQGILLLAQLFDDPPGPSTDLSDHGIDVAAILADIRAEALEKALIEKQRGASKNIKAGKKKDPKAVKAAKGAA
jgi:ParB/RepB/Spo0J family partition protein